MVRVLNWTRRNFFFVFVTLLVATLFFINRYIYQHRFEGYMYQEAINYVQFYYTQSDYRVSGLQKKDADTLCVKIEPSQVARRWCIITPVKSYTMAGTCPSIKLEPGICAYKVQSDMPYFNDTINLRIEFLNGDIVFNYCSLPTIGYELFPVDKWTHIPKTISEEEKVEVRNILKNEIGISDTLNSLEKIKRIGRFLLSKMRKNEGSPSDTIKGLTPLRQYKTVCELKDTIDCAVWADIFFLFANCADVPTRRIGVGGSLDYIGVSGHVFDECYIKEQQRWAFVDLTSRKLMVVDEKGRVFNSVGLMQLNRWEQYCAMKTVTIDDNDNIIEKKYELTNQSELDYLKQTILLYSIRANINNNMNFRESFEEFLGTKDHYGVAYSNLITIDNSKHYLKLFIFKTSVGVFFLWLFFVLFEIVKLVYRAIKIERKI